MYQVWSTRYQVSFYLWWFTRKLNYEKLPKYSDQDCAKILFYSLNFQWWLKFLENIPSLAQKCYFREKATNRESSKLSKVKIWPRLRMQISSNTEQLNFERLTQLTCFIFLSRLEKYFELEKLPRNSTLKETGLSYGKHFVSSDNPGQNIWHKVKRYNKIGQNFQNIISNFPCFFTAIVNV